MKQVNVVIVGGSAAGPVAAMTAKRHYPDKSVLEIRKEKPERVMVPCGVPYIFGTVGTTDKNVIPDAIVTNNGAELMIDEVTDIDRSARTVTTAGGETVSYDKLILATGSNPVSPPIPGKELENVFFVKKDADYIDDMLKKLADAKDIVVIGGGFIGVEMADEIQKMGGKNVTIVEMLPHCLQLALDEDQCIEAEKKLTERGIKVLTEATAKNIAGEGKVSGVELGSGETLKADAVIIGIGAVPNTELAQKAGLEIGPMRGIKVDEYMRTATDENVFAAGDCADKFSFFTGKPSGLRLASIAGIEAHIAGANLFQLKRKNEGAIGVFATIIGDDCFSVAGLTEKAAKEAGYEIVIGESSAPDTHPGGMPGSKTGKIKLVVDKKTGKILGGEMMGGRTAAEVANIMSAFISSGWTADQAATFQMGTQPALTASPIVYQIVNAAELALTKM
ncbi:MAG: FAD/NAD(P)-binding oxidoreductase [Dehalococcoidia bacterium]